MRAFELFLLPAIMLVAGEAAAKEMFTLSSAGNSGVTLQVSVSSNPRDGYVREAGNYSHGETHPTATAQRM